MFIRGINYDIGTEFRKGILSRPNFDEMVIRKEIEIIRNDLHCDAIRISGFDINRLITATQFALEAGLQVWLSPANIDATPEEALQYLTDCARAAEPLREKYQNLIFVVGCEYSLFLKGFIKGETIYDRLKRMFSPVGIVANLLGLRQPVYNKLNRFLEKAARRVRENFGGQLTYASGTWEKINWKLFDVVGIDHYRASYNKSIYLKQLTAYYRFNKPVALLEFGCCTYRGAEEKGGAGWAITEVKDGRQIIKGDFVRDETVQANYIEELLKLFEKEPVHAAFVFTFINPVYKFNPDPRFDLDMASYGLVKPVDAPVDQCYNGLSWIPKEAFHRLAAWYEKMNIEK